MLISLNAVEVRRLHVVTLMFVVATNTTFSTSFSFKILLLYLTTYLTFPFSFLHGAFFLTNVGSILMQTMFPGSEFIISGSNKTLNGHNIPASYSTRNGKEKLVFMLLKITS